MIILTKNPSNEREEIKNKLGSRRTIEKFAWFPSKVYLKNGDIKYVWLQKYAEEQIYVGYVFWAGYTFKGYSIPISSEHIMNHTSRFGWENMGHDDWSKGPVVDDGHD